MLIIDDKVKRLPYTLREIVELYYPEFWGGANECVRIARALQDLATDLMSLYGPHLPASLDLIKEQKQSQIIYSKFLTGICIYGLGKKLWEIADDNCRKLAQSANESDSETGETAKSALSDLMSFIDRFNKSIVEINDDENGFQALNNLIDSYTPDLDFPVMNQWSYRDVVGTIRGEGLFYERLWHSVVSYEIPKASNIPDLMEGPDDNKMVRIY